ncbi:hypothetical protein ACHEKC_000352 [Salmonella enterica subsp. enterica serovar Newport]
MCRSIYRFGIISALIFPLVAFNVSASPCFSNNSVTKGTKNDFKVTRDKDCNDSDSSSRKSVSEKIIESIAEKQKINQEIMKIDLEIGLLRTKKGNMTAQDYDSKMRELTNKRSALKRKI